MAPSHPHPSMTPAPAKVPEPGVMNQLWGALSPLAGDNAEQKYGPLVVTVLFGLLMLVLAFRIPDEQIPDLVDFLLGTAGAGGVGWYVRSRV